MTEEEFEYQEYQLTLCSCGSGEEKYPLHDRMGIFTGNVCTKCVKKHKAKFAPHVFGGTTSEYMDEIYHHGERFDDDY